MYAIIQTGGKQYKVFPGDQLKVEKIKGEPGDKVELGQILALIEPDNVRLGSPIVEDVSVNATLIKTARDRKIIVFKKKRRHGYHKKQGHRQWYSLLRIDSISTTGPHNVAVATEA
ncbi:MAG: 50S ribosomal protein L21 [Syntrophaceae bacterium]|nr:50S ribosomal protein L21 [Syntrophaceae bacterium]